MILHNHMFCAIYIENKPKGCASGYGNKKKELFKKDIKYLEKI